MTVRHLKPVRVKRKSYFSRGKLKSCKSEISIKFSDHVKLSNCRKMLCWQSGTQSLNNLASLFETSQLILLGMLSSSFDFSCQVGQRMFR